MGQRRIAFAPEEALLLTVDRGDVIAYEPLDGSIKWTFSVDEVNLVAVVYVSAGALASDVAAGPWRSPSSASTAVALDEGGVLHVLDAVLGRELGTLAHEGLSPVTLASGGDALAVGFADRVVLHRAGAKHEIMKRGTALAFSRDGLTLAIGTARGELFFVDVGTRNVTSFEPPVGGNISDVVARPGGGWLVSSERGLTAVYSEKNDGPSRNEKQLNGAVTGAVVDAAGKCLAVHRSEANVVLYAWPPTVPVGRISASGGTIRDLAFGANDKLGVAMAGGGAAIVDPGTYEVRKTAPRAGQARAPWSVGAESEEQRTARTDEQSRRAQAHEPKSGLGARLGIGGLISLAILVVRIFLIGARASTPSYTPTDFGNFGTSYKGCDHSCELTRLTDLDERCERSPRSSCAEDSEAALVAFKRNDCAGVEKHLLAIESANKGADGGPDALIGAEVLLATIGLKTSCYPSGRDAPRKSSYTLVHLDNNGVAEETDRRLTLDGADEHVLWSSNEGELFLATRAVKSSTCEVRHAKSKDSSWMSDLHDVPCTNVRIFGRSAREVYVGFGRTVRRFDGTEWKPPIALPEEAIALAGSNAPGADVFAQTQVGSAHALFRFNARTTSEPKLVSTDDAVEQLFSGQALWGYGTKGPEDNLLYKWSGTSWVRRSGLNDAGSETRTFRTLWQSPNGHLFAANEGTIVRSTNDGATWELMGIEANVDHIWGRSATDVYAAGFSGLWHYDGKTWTELDFAEPIVMLSGDSKRVHALVQKR